MTGFLRWFDSLLLRILLAAMPRARKWRHAGVTNTVHRHRDGTHLVTLAFTDKHGDHVVIEMWGKPAAIVVAIDEVEGIML